MSLRTRRQRKIGAAVGQSVCLRSKIDWKGACRRTFLITGLATLASFGFPEANAFLSPQSRTTRTLATRAYSRCDGLSTTSPIRRLSDASARSNLRMSSAVMKRDRRGVYQRLVTRVSALVRGSGRCSRFERLAHQAVSTLRAVKRKAAKQALVVALTVAFIFPSLNLPLSLSGGAGAGNSNAPGGVGIAGTTVEMVLPSQGEAANPSTNLYREAFDAPAKRKEASLVSHSERGPVGGLGRAARGRATVGARGVPSRTAFVGPWMPEESGILTAESGRTRENTLEMARSLAQGVLHNGREIAEEFGHHLKGARRDVLVILLANALIIPVCKRVGLSPVLGFLSAGILLGPNCLSIVSDVKAIEVLGEMGIVFFLFEMGLELSVSRMMAMKRDVFGMGLATFGVSAAAVAGVGYMAGLTGAQMVVIGGGVALSSSAFVLQLLRDRDDLGTRYGRACFGILLFQDLAVVPLLVAIPLLAGGGGGLVAALSSAATKAAIALGLIAFIGNTVLNRFFLLVAKSKSQEAFLAVILLTVIALATITEGLGLSGTLGAFLAGTLLSETKYTPQVEADIAPFRALLLGMFFMTVGFEIDLALCFNKLPLVTGLVSGLLAMKAAIIAMISLAFGLSVANAQQTGLLLSQGGEFAFVAFGMATSLGIIEPQLCKLLLTTVALSMAATPALSNLSAWIADQMEGRMGYDHYVGGDSESDEIRQGGDFVVVCGFGRIGKLVCELLGKKFINFVAFDNNPLKAMEARNRGLPVFYGDVFRPEVLNAFNVSKAKAVICTLSDVNGTNKAVVNLRRAFPDLPIFARAKDSKHQQRLASIMDVVAMVPTLPEDSIIVSLPFGGAVLRSLGCSTEEVNVLLEETRKKFVMEKGLENEEDDNLFEQLGLSRTAVEGYTDAGASPSLSSEDEGVLEGSEVSEVKGASSAVAVAVAVGAVPAVGESVAIVEAGGDGSRERQSGAVSAGAPMAEHSIAGGDGQAMGTGSALSEEDESLASAKAAAAAEAAAALEAAVASGDVTYPSIPDSDEDRDSVSEGDGLPVLAIEKERAEEQAEEEQLVASLNPDVTATEGSSS